MTELLEKALAAVSKLPKEDQDAVAAIVLDEIASEKRWNEAFAGSQDKLSQLADEALNELRAGRTKPLD